MAKCFTLLLFYFHVISAKKETPKTPVKGIAPRIKNIVKNNFRGLIGTVLPLLVLSHQTQEGNEAKSVELIWMWMFWFFLWQPVSIPVTGLIPVFMFPCVGVMSSVDVCQCYMNENVLLFLLGSMILLLLNNSGVDRRIMLWFLCSGDHCQFSGKRLIFKVSAAAFFLSMFSNRLIISSSLTQYMTTALFSMKSTMSKPGEPNFDEMRYIINNAIQTSSSIGSTAILHSSYATMLFRAIFVEYPPKTHELPDIFNYLQYSAFAFPVAFIMYILNFCYHMILINQFIITPMTTASMTEMRKILLKFRSELPKNMSVHEKLSIIFAIFYLLMFFFRWSHWIHGWAEFSRDHIATQIPKVKDATVAAIFLLVLHILPKGYGFLKYLSADKKSQLPPIKPESGILWWKFVDKNVNYGYFFLFGAGAALIEGTRVTGVNVDIAENWGKQFTERPWNSAMFLICFLAALLANVTTAVAACAVFLPFVICLVDPDTAIPWPSKFYVGALGVGMSASFGFCLPFQYTPAYFCHYTGKVPVMKMLKYSFLSVWICLLTLWVALVVWAPFLFDPDDNGIIAVRAPKPVVFKPLGDTTPGGAAPPPEEPPRL